jgi:hypothetical protein
MLAMANVREATFQRYHEISFDIHASLPNQRFKENNSIPRQIHSNLHQE